mgnify:CR=1 FL=1
MGVHDGIQEMTEEEAAVLFEAAEVRVAFEKTAAHFRDSDTIAYGAEDMARRGQLRRVEAEAKQRLGADVLQAAGGRIAHVEANEVAADAQEQILRAALEHNRSEIETLKGERIWAELAAKYGAFVPHPQRLEVQAREFPGRVYCFDAGEGEMALHDEGLCPTATLRHDTGGTRMLRRKGPGGKLVMWPGRKE